MAAVERLEIMVGSIRSLKWLYESQGWIRCQQPGVTEVRWVSKSDERTVYLSIPREQWVCTAEPTRMVHSQGNNKITMYSEASVG